MVCGMVAGGLVELGRKLNNVGMEWKDAFNPLSPKDDVDPSSEKNSVDPTGPEVLYKPPGDSNESEAEQLLPSDESASTTLPVGQADVETNPIGPTSSATQEL